MTTSVITTDIDFEGLRDDWKRLHASAEGNIFQTFEWLWTWWQIYGKRFRLRTLTGWDDSRLVGVFPCFLQTINLRALRIARLSFVGEYAVPGEYAPLVDPSYEPAFLGPVIDFCTRLVLSGDCDFIDFHRFPPTSNFMQALLGRLRTSGFTVKNNARYAPGVVVDLPHSWEHYFRSLSSKERDTLKRGERLLQTAGASIEIIEDRKDLPRAFGDFEALHTRVWNAKGKEGHFAIREKFGEFLMLATTRLLESRSVRLYFYTCGGARFAALQAFAVNGYHALYLSGRNPDHPLAKFSPGQVLIGRALRDAISSGFGQSDFLEGPMPYKLRLGGKISWYSRATVVRNGLRGFGGRLALAALRVRDFSDSPQARRLLGSRLSGVLSRLKTSLLHG